MAPDDPSADDFRRMCMCMCMCMWLCSLVAVWSASGRNRTFNLALKKRLLCLLSYGGKSGHLRDHRFWRLVFGFQRSDLCRARSYVSLASPDASAASDSCPLAALPPSWRSWRGRDSNPQCADARRLYRPVTEPNRCPLRLFLVFRMPTEPFVFCGVSDAPETKKAGSPFGPGFRSFLTMSRDLRAGLSCDVVVPEATGGP